MSLYVSLFMDLSPSKRPPPPVTTHCPFPEQSDAFHVSRSCDAGSSDIKLFKESVLHWGRWSPCVHLPEVIFCFVLKPPLPLAPPTLLVTLRALRKIPGLHAVSPPGLEGCDSSVTDYWTFLLPCVKHFLCQEKICFPPQVILSFPILLDTAVTLPA